jgi:hypothetical protein
VKKPFSPSDALASKKSKPIFKLPDLPKIVGDKYSKEDLKHWITYTVPGGMLH